MLEPEAVVGGNCTPRMGRDKEDGSHSEKRKIEKREKGKGKKKKGKIVWHVTCGTHHATSEKTAINTIQGVELNRVKKFGFIAKRVKPRYPM